MSDSDNSSDPSYPRRDYQGFRRTMFRLDEEGNSQEDIDRLMNSVEAAARRVVEHNQTTAPPRPILGVKGDEFFEPPSPYSGEAGMVNVRRPVYTQSAFTKIFEENRVEEHVRSRFFDSVLLPDNPKKRCGDILLGIFPFISMLRNYDVKKNLLLDVASGFTTGIMRIPQSMAYALLAHLPPSFGLYTAFFSAVFYFVFGGSHHMAAGAQGVISLMVGAGVERVLHFSSDMANISVADLSNATKENPRSDPVVMEVLDIVVTITFLVGVFQALMGIFRLGFVTNYLSDPLIGGFTTGAACHVVVSQLSTILGVKTDSHSGNFNLWKLLFEVLSKVEKANVVSFMIFIVSFFILCSIKHVNDRFKRILKVPIPGELIILGMSILFCYLTEADRVWSVRVVGHVPSGFLPPRLPDPKYMESTLSIAFPTAIVSFAIGYSIAKRLALQNDYEISGSQEIFAFGFMNMSSSCFNCFAATASMSVSSLHESLGGKTQIANLIASILVLLTLLFVGPIFRTAPDCVLSAILLINLKSILFQFKDLKPLWILSKIDFLLWLVTWLAVIILDVDLGLGIGVAFSLLTIVFRTQWPYTCILGRIPSTDIYKNRMITPNAQEVSGIKIFRFEGSLYFASAEHFRNSLYHETDCNPVKILRRKLEVEHKLKIVKEQMRSTLISNGSTLYENGQGSAPSSYGSLFDDRLLTREKSDIHHIVIDFSACSFMDSVGVRALSQVLVDYQEVGITVCLANVRAAVRSVLLNAKLFTSEVSTKHIYVSTHDAVLDALVQVHDMDERDFILADAATHVVSRQISVMNSDIE